ncbi:MAG: HEAT repeat domain-containing protein [Desulfovibrionaceae bacterium]
MSECEAILKRLAGDDNEQLREAAFEAGEAPCPEAVPRLAELLKSRNLGVQEAADRALRHIGGSPVVLAVIPLLRSDEAPVRNLSMDILRQVADQDLENVIALLQDDDPDMRIFAADILGSTKSGMAVRPLCEAMLKDPEVNVRYQAAVSLGDLARPEAAQSLGRAMSDEEWVQYAAVEALAKVGDAGSVDALVKSLDHTSDLVRSMVIDALAEVGNVKAATKMLKRMGGASSAIRNKMVKAVVSILGGDALRLLSPDERENLRQYMLVALEDEAEDVQDAAVQGLGSVGGEVASQGILELAARLDPDRDTERIQHMLDALASIGLTEALKRGLRSEDPALALVAAAALARVEAPEVAQVFVAAFWECNQSLQRHMVGVLAERCGAEAKDFFFDVLDRHRDGTVLKAALAYVGRQRLDEAVGRLFVLLDHPYDDVKEAALEALVAIGGEEVEARFSDMAHSSEPISRLMAVYAMGKLDAGAHLEFLKAALEDESPDVRKIALEAVSTVCFDDDAAWLALVVPRLGDESRDVRLAVVEILGNCYGPSVEPYLLQALDDQDDWVRVRALEALGRNRVKAAVPRLVELLEHPNKLVAIKSIEALGAIGGQSAFRALLEITGSGDPELAEAAELAVESIGRESDEGE